MSGWRGLGEFRPCGPLGVAPGGSKISRMPTAAIVYCSATWTTAGLGEDIARVLTGRGIETRIAAIGEIDTAGLADVDSWWAWAASRS